jgi:hypothetical protein
MVKLNRTTEFLHKLALAHDLPNPLGRAAAISNRIANGGLPSISNLGANSVHPPYAPITEELYISALHAVQAGTARNWMAHVLHGGSIKTLRCSAVQYRKERAKYVHRLRTSAQQEKASI